jgi:hypothetical protein
MKNLFKYFVLALSFSFVLLISDTYAFGGDKQLKTWDIPPKIMTKANNYLKNKMTKKFFNKYVTLDSLNTKRSNSGYWFQYKLYIPEKPFVKGGISFKIDSLGKIDEEHAYGVHDIKSDPIKGEFNIDEAKAEQIAKEARLEPGIYKWGFLFYWDKDYKLYAWHVSNTLESIRCTGEGKTGNGNTIIIDANTGQILKHSGWISKVIY